MKLGTLLASSENDFKLTGLGKQTAKELYPFPDLLAFLDASPTLLAGQGQSTGFPNVAPATPSPYLHVRAAVEAQFTFAKRVLNYSWHRMYPAWGADGPQFDAAMVRYRRFMTLNRFVKEIRGLESGATEAGGGFFWPALDVEFVWRTHMLSVTEYRRFSQTTYGAPTPAIATGESVDLAHETSRVYRRVFGDAYDLCLCWSCVDSRSRRAHSHSDKKAFASELRLAESRHVRAGKACTRCGTHAYRGCRERHSRGRRRQSGSAERRQLVRRAERVSVSSDDMFHGQSRTNERPAEARNVWSWGKRRVRTGEEASMLEPLKAGPEYASEDELLWGPRASGLGVVGVG